MRDNNLEISPLPKIAHYYCKSSSLTRMQILVANAKEKTRIFKCTFILFIVITSLYAISI